MGFFVTSSRIRNAMSGPNTIKLFDEGGRIWKSLLLTKSGGTVGREALQAVAQPPFLSAR